MIEMEEGKCWICLSRSNTNLLAQPSSLHMVIGNVVDIWNVYRAFWDETLE